MIKEFNVSGSLTLLNVDKTSDRNGKYHNPSPTAVSWTQRKTGGENIWFSPESSYCPSGTV